MNPNPFSLMTLVQDLGDELNILAIEYNFKPISISWLSWAVEYIEKALAKTCCPELHVGPAGGIDKIK